MSRFLAPVIKGRFGVALLIGLALVIGACGEGDDATGEPSLQPDETGLSIVDVPGDDATTQPLLPPELDGLPVIDVHGDDFQRYPTAAELVAASDAVVGGTITSVVDGRFTPYEEEEGPGGERLVVVTLTIDIVIAGSDVVPGDTAVIEPSGYEIDGDGTPIGLHIVNGVPFPTVGSDELWFLKDYDAQGWGLTDIDDGRFARSADSVRALARSGGPAAREVERLGVNGLVQLVDEGFDEGVVFRTGDTRLDTAEGPGWGIWAFERGKAVGGHLASIVTSDRGLDPLREVGGFETSRPEIMFDQEVLIVLTPGVSGSCPDIVLEGLVIGDTEVFGAFRFPTSGSGSGATCTADFNPVTFFFIVERRVLPERFTLSVSEEFGRCEGCSIDVDLSTEATLEGELWGTGTLALATAGTAPPAGAFNVVQWTIDGEVGALLFSADGWSESPTWFQSFGDRGADRIDGFVASCAGAQCEECEGEACAALPRFGEVCSRPYEATPFEDQTFVVTFEGTSCSIEVVPGLP